MSTTTVLTAAAAQAADAAATVARAALSGQIAALAARVAVLEAGKPVVPPVIVPPTESADGALMPPLTVLVDAQGRHWTLFGGQLHVEGVVVADTSGVDLAKYSGHAVYQRGGGAWYGPSSAATGGSAIAGEPGVVVTPPVTTLPPVVTGTVTGFTVSQAAGILDNLGNRWELRGYNCDCIGSGAFDKVKVNLFAKFPGANMCRVVCDQGTGVAEVQSMVAALTARKMISFIDYHDQVQGGTIAWYQVMAAAFKSNPYVFMETPNEPSINVASDQIAIINALRAAGWTNPIGLELHGGFLFDNIPPVRAACAQGNQLFLCPHNYGDWWNGSMQSAANATLLYSVVDEFGDSMDGSNVDANGTACVIHIIQSQQAHQNGAAFWSATNNWHEGDNLFLDPQGTTLSSMGKLIQQMGWLA
jgi:hypothetical protein